MNLIEAKAIGGQATIGDYSVPVDPAAAQKMHGDVTIGVRPEAWRVVGNSEDGLPVRVDVVEDLGADAFVYGTGDIGGTSRSITIRASGRNHPNKGEMMYITTDPRNLHVFDTATGSRLSD